MVSVDPAPESTRQPAEAVPARLVSNIPGDAALTHALISSGTLPAGAALAADRAARQAGIGLRDYLLAAELCSEPEVLRAVAMAEGTSILDLEAEPPDARLMDPGRLRDWLAAGALPWRRIGDVLIVAAWDRNMLRDRGLIPPGLRVGWRVASRAQIEATILGRHGDELARQAESLAPERFSCRRVARPISATLVLAALALGTGMALIPDHVMTGLMLISLFLVAGNATLRAMALLRDRISTGRRAQNVLGFSRLPRMSILLPLYHEGAVLPQLLAGIEALDYPPELLDVLLLVEEDDLETAAAAAALPHRPWLRIVTVPRGRVQTKPRAMNFALPLCRGSIIGIFDAEDHPDPDQLRRVAARFATAPPETACLQGVLGFYNSQQNWVSRAFAIEYASWFRVILPGIARLGLPVPLGGTTVYTRRDALERAGGWDAHNVTEDADLGIRLGRLGYRTEVLDTVTLEEANFRPRAWIRQRSRWLKGYAMTWAVHMRSPRSLWKELGAWQFLGIHALFLGTLATFATAPLLWSLWLVSLGVDHPSLRLVPGWFGYAVTLIFGLSQIVQASVTLLALWRAGHRGLLPWVPVLAFYWPMATVAVYKALWELVTRPFYWDKTAHGLSAAPVAAPGSMTHPSAQGPSAPSLEG